MKNLDRRAPDTSPHPRIIVALSTCFCALVASAGLGVFGAAAFATEHVVLARNVATEPSAASIISTMKSAAAHEKSVRLTIHATQQDPKASETITVNAGPTTGSQTAISGKQRASVLLTKSYAYLSGNSSGLTEFFSLPADDISLVGTKWISIKSGTSQYKSFVTAITEQHLMSNLLPTTKAVKVKSARLADKPVYELNWTVKNTSGTTDLSLTINRDGKELPLAESASTGTTVERSYFTNWDEKIDIVAPRATIAISKLHSS